MNIKTKIKNDLWQINYIIPFTIKYLQEGKISYIKKSLPVLKKLKVIRGKRSSNIADDIYLLLKSVELKPIKNTFFFYSIDEYKTITVKGNIISNFTLDYEKIIYGSFLELADKAINAGNLYGERAKKIKKAVIEYRDRVLEYLKMDNDRNELISIFNIILEQKAEHFADGLQRILFFNQILWQTRHRLNGLGRLDKILYPLYAADIENGFLSKKKAYSLMCDFLICLHQWYEFKSASLLGDIGQIIVLGGMDSRGNYFSNELTEMWMEAQAQLRYPDPKVILRVCKKTPDNILKTAVHCISAGTGSPLFSNDEVVIKCLEKFGFETDDADDYCVSACWEPYIPGKTFDQNNIKVFDYFKVLDKCLRTNNLSCFETFNELVAAYKQSLEIEWKKFLINLNEIEWAMDPLVSMFIEGCNEQSKDISEGGAMYSNYGVTTIGIANTCDSLLNIKELVYETGQYTLEEIERIRLKNYKKNPEVFAQIKNMPKSFGHDREEGIKLVNQIIGISNEIISEYRNPFGGRIKFGLSSPAYVTGARKTNADFSGKKFGTSYVTHISCLDVAYTELVSFAGKIEYEKCFNGNVIDFFLSPNIINNYENVFIDFLKGAIELGFFQMQMNIMDSKTLIDAKSYPEKYPGLIVRVWGFSAYFNDLPEQYKDVLIQRAIQNEITNY